MRTLVLFYSASACCHFRRVLCALCAACAVCCVCCVPCAVRKASLSTTVTPTALQQHISLIHS